MHILNRNFLGPIDKAAFKATDRLLAFLLRPLAVVAFVVGDVYKEREKKEGRERKRTVDASFRATRKITLGWEYRSQEVALRALVRIKFLFSVAYLALTR